MDCPGEIARGVFAAAGLGCRAILAGKHLTIKMMISSRAGSSQFLVQKPQVKLLASNQAEKVATGPLRAGVSEEVLHENVADAIKSPNANGPARTGNVARLAGPKMRARE